MYLFYNVFFDSYEILINVYLINGGIIVNHNSNKKKVKPCFYSCDNIITNVNKEFIEFTGFTCDELLGKSLMEIGAIIRLNLQILLEHINVKYSGYIFTKSLSAREVNISLFYNKEKNEKSFNFIELPNTRLDDKLIFEKQTLDDNIVGIAIYSIPDLIMLKVNQKYLDFHDYPYNQMETSIGLSIREVVTGYVGTQSEVITNTVIETQKSSYMNEIKFERFSRGVTYWDSTRTPIFDNGKMKYMVLSTFESTDRVLRNESIEQQNRLIEQQNQQLEQQKKQLEHQKEQLELKNTQLNSILENLSEGVMVADNKGKYMMINSEARRLLYQSDQIINSGDSSRNIKYYDTKGNQITVEKYPANRALNGEAVRNVKMFVSHPDKEFFIEASSIPIYYQSGDLTMVVTCFHDISEIIEQSRKIEEQKKELEAILENISDGITAFDDKGKYILFNKSAREMFRSYNEYFEKIGDGYKQSEFYDVDGVVIDSENNPALRVLRGETFKNVRMSIKYPYKTLQVAVSGTPIFDSEGKFILGVICNRDMTDYFKHEEAIRSRYEFMNKMIDTFNLPFVRLSCPDLEIVDINKKAFVIAELLFPNIKSTVQLKGNKVETLYKEFKTSEYYLYICQVFRDKKTKYLNKQKHIINGSEVYWNVIFEPMLGVNGEIQEILILIVDVTAEIESNIVMEKILKSQEEFFANISHELKTPLTVISSTIQLLKLYYSNNSLDEKKESVIKHINSMKQNCFRLSKLINNIVDSSKIEAGFFELNLSNNNIVEVVEEIVMSLINFTDSKGLNIIFDTNAEEKIIACDPEKIERIVLNLISNAIKFSDDGDEIFVDIRDKNEFVEISVKDNGIGIENKNLDMIFGRFKQVDKSLSRNTDGTGIGLSLVKSIVELHGGSIYVESEIGKGSTFTIVLPTTKVMQENMLFSSKIRTKGEIIQVELSDVHA